MEILTSQKGIRQSSVQVLTEMSGDLGYESDGEALSAVARFYAAESNQERV